jgi:hypothetical protein
VEHHAANRHLRLEHLLDVPGDRLSFAVFVRREQQLVGGGKLLLEPGHDLLLVGVDDVVRLEIVVHRDTERAVLLALGRRDLARLLGQVANVPDARLDVVARPQITRDRPRFRGGLDDDETLLSVGRHGRTR